MTSVIREPTGRSTFGLRDLTRIRLLALRRRVFFRVLNRVERGLIYLAPKVTGCVRSRVLADALRSVVEKLLDAMESNVERRMRQIGVPLAQKISRIAQGWGNKKAHKWANDPGFIQYLTIATMVGWSEVCGG
jgi:hypothetical protein